ncbi:MAG TPA: hypothetical protein VGC13_15070 [Longimicrobium sp.]|jgi:hypothetical protein|uniref:hypothetical protein n=1 Tax=Longimicrobium sp. TaxID=2029185 RepID=UPI002ED8430D
MKKLALDLDELCVESFDTTAPPKDSRGTVQGNMQSYYGGTCAQTCYTCAGTCQVTCYNSCAGTCHEPSCNGGTCYASCQGSCYDQSCGGSCAGQHTCAAGICIPF